MFDDLFCCSGLSLDRLRSFLAFARAGSIAKAAPGNETHQSQISRQISELEAFFGTELTERRGKTLAPSAAGLQLATIISHQFQDLEDFRVKQKDAKRTFIFGAGASIHDWLVIPAIVRIGKAMKGASLRLDTLRSGALVEEVKDGRIDFAIVRDDAVPADLPRLPLLRLSFHLCVPRSLLKHGTAASAIKDPKTWITLPFAAGKDGGQLDLALRQAMNDAVGEFRPSIECNSMLQARQLIERGVCAGVLPSVGIHGLPDGEVIVSEFAPLKNHARTLVLHWNDRQMRRRGVEMPMIEQIAAALR